MYREKNQDFWKQLALGSFVLLAGTILQVQSAHAIVDICIAYSEKF